jgi:molybdate transport system substrate-binding protein
MDIRRTASVLAALIWLGLAGAASAQAAGEVDKLANAPPGSVRIFASGAVRAPIEALRARIETATGRKMVVESSESRVLQKEIEAGQPFEAALLTTVVIKDMTAAGKIVPGSLDPLAVVRVGVSVRGDAPKLDVASPAGLKAAILGAHSVRRFYGPAASTPILDNLFDKLDLTEATKTRMVALGQGVVPPEAPLGPGQYELIINLASAIIPMKGWTYLGLIPEQYQMPVAHSAGLGAAGDQAAGRKVIAIFESPEFEAALKAAGSSRR